MSNEDLKRMMGEELYSDLAERARKEGLIPDENATREMAAKRFIIAIDDISNQLEHEGIPIGLCHCSAFDAALMIGLKTMIKGDVPSELIGHIFKSRVDAAISKAVEMEAAING